ncbi:SpoIID/LytB domain protein [Alkaliphilus metalliredigens QYMF]|uniref:SpoIID/LytB domain protein n=1 Tax=Alkaliphilus metalliredigens (strain QYMF) TaxID=293826 RepID=A6TJN7_ALKMQ|nr:SpoIID/LytB domain-containing protein [Alkaliphilus metalliredigens]ABR46405.1 SpoIID/LytB domain protein [Alkaliphilus metalliredigens QYMF]
MLKFRKISILFFVMILIVALIGCRAAERPEDDQTPDQAEEGEQPPIPDEITRGEGEEPVLKVYIHETGEIREMSIEEYLIPVVAGEMTNDWPEEALAAQAILARTFVMEFITDKGGSKYEGAHVSTDIEEAQAWSEEEVNDLVTQAVETTRGQVMVYEGQYVKSWFHAHAGMQTATAQEGLGFEAEEPPYIQVIESPDSQEAPEDDANWTETFTKAEIIAAAQESGQEPGDFTAIEVAETGPSGRATQLQIGEATVAAPAFRIALDSTRMKSTKLESVQVEGDQVTMSGTGYGHGVGMSQWGAYQMAQDGSSAEDIVNHYFKDVQIMKLWE